MTDRRVRIVHHGVGNDTGEQEIVDALDNATIMVRVAGDQPGWPQQLLAIALVDMLGRLFPRIDAVCASGAEADPRLPPGPAVLAERLEEARTHGIGPQAPGTRTVTVHVGNGDDPADVYVDGDGWMSFIGSAPSQLPAGDSDMPFGPLTAAARGAAHAFELALQALRPPRPLPNAAYWSALVYQRGDAPFTHPDPAIATVIEAVLVGAGSVGGAAVYAFARTPGLTGPLDVVDPQTLEGHNFDRALLATTALADSEQPKAAVACDALSHRTGLAATPHRCDMASFVAARPRDQPLPRVLCAVDSAGARRSIQDCLPLDVVNAACNQDEAFVSGHRTGAGPCVMCMRMARIMDSEQIRYRLIAQATGLPAETVLGLMVGPTPLSSTHLRVIESNLNLPAEALSPYENRDLETLYREQLVYGGAQLATSTGAAVAVAAPWVTALTGFLLAAETVKASVPALADHALGPGAHSPGVQYRENVYASPLDLQLTRPERWPTEQCLCRSPRRRRLIVERYTLDPDEYPA